MADSPDPFSMPTPPLATALTSGALADRLVETVTTKLAELEASTAPGLRLPRVHGGHRVNDDTTADLLYVVGLLIDCGVEEAAGIDLRSIIPDLIRTLDPAKVEGFYSYRVGETVLRIGGLDALPDELRSVVTEAVESPQIIKMITEGGQIPPNFSVVAARALEAQARLAGGEVPAQRELFVDRVRELFGGTDNGWIDDGMEAWVHYDIYTPDMYLFAEPLVDEIGDDWARGLTAVMRDLDALAQPGGAVVWGRSIGALGLAITIELAAAAVGRDLDVDQACWLARGADTLDDLAGWFPNGVIAAHQHRSTMFYRGTPRRLQMTLDIYGKLLLAALELRRHPDVMAADAGAVYEPADRFVDFDAERNAGAWAYRSPSLSFVLPTVLGFSSDYLPSPRGPGLFEQPTSGPPTMLPVITLDDGHRVPSGMPETVEHQPGQLTLRHVGWSPTGTRADDDAAVAGTRDATYRIEGRSLVVDEVLTFDEDLPGPLSISVAEVAGRPLNVEATGAAHRTLAVDTDGITEWRSFWNVHPRVHQIEIEPADRVELTWRVTPRLRVAHAIHGHPYDQALYGPLDGLVVRSGAGFPGPSLARQLRDVDVLHMAWPEWWTGTDPGRTREVIDIVRRSGTGIVWTQHNLLPHFYKTDDARESYQAWAESADAVIHHTEVGKALALDTYTYGAHTTHHVIAHGHWGHQYTGMRATNREMIELSEGWSPCAIRLGIIGSPRAEKDIQQVVDAVAACGRDDIQLVVRVDLGVQVPDDPRIIAEFGHVEDNRYHNRLAAYDALVLPFNKPGMMTTGTAFDAIGAGVGAITADWDFFDETFEGADIRYDGTTDDLVRVLEQLDAETLATARDATVALQPRFEWSAIATQTLAVLENATTRV